MEPAKMMRVLVTASGGDLGQAIVKCLRMGSLSYEIHGGDMQDGGVPGLFVDRFHRLPSARDAKYVERLNELCQAERIAAVIPASEAEISVLCRCAGHPVLPCGTRVVSQSPRINQTFGDKLLGFEALRGHVPLADFAAAHERGAAEAFLDSHPFPVCMKERVSSGRKGVLILGGRDEFEHEWPRFSQPVLQEVIDSPEREYSIGVFCHGAETRIIGFRRRLERLGCSWYAELNQPLEVMDYCRQIATVVGAQGSFNIQLRLSSRGPLLLEINPRFSSLAAARAACGFNDVEWSVMQAVGIEPPPASPAPSAFRYQRFLAEAIDLGDGAGLHVPAAWAARTR